jgi:TRAP-type C4-dicarboxylate transport system substrate-binding protein
MITSPSTGVDTKAWDFVSHYHDTRAWLPRNMVIVSQQAFDALTPEQQAALEESAAEAEARGWEMSEVATEEAMKTLAENGITIVEPSEELKAEFARIGETIANEWVENAGEDGKALIEAYRSR